MSPLCKELNSMLLSNDDDDDTVKQGEFSWFYD